MRTLSAAPLAARTGTLVSIALRGGQGEPFGRLSTLACSLTARLPPAPTGDTDLIQTDAGCPMSHMMVDTVE